MRRLSLLSGVALAAMGSVEQELEAEWKAVVTSRYQLSGTPTTQKLAVAGLPENLVRTAGAKVGSLQDLMVSVAVIPVSGTLRRGAVDGETGPER